MTNIAIIGAGLSGLTVAQQMRDYADITVFEKSRGIGGRMATRRASPYLFDHGAQYFTAKTPTFQRYLLPLINVGIIQQWQARIATIAKGQVVIHPPNKNVSHKENLDDHSWDTSLYVATPNMNTLAKHLSQDILVIRNTQVAHLQKYHDQWLLSDDQNNLVGNYDWVISSIPAPQAVHILPNHLPYYSALKGVAMQSCFSLMLGFQQALSLNFDAAFVKDSAIAWIAVNSAKPHKNQAYSLLVQSSHNWAEQHALDDKQELIDVLCQQIHADIGQDVKQADHQALHFWRYANIGQQIGATHIIDTQEAIGICGDWFIQGRVEAAFTSGFELSQHLISAITTQNRAIAW